MPHLPLSQAIQKYLIPWQTLDWPIAWTERFGRPGDLIVEIGFGNGAFLTDMAMQHPERLYVGIERAWGSISRLFTRLETAGISNVHTMEADAAFALERLFGPQSLSEIYINFPDPWHKERHHNRRLIQPAFVQTLSERLRPGGAVTIATDQMEYAAWIAEVLEGQSRLQSAFPTPFVTSLNGRKPTKYEQKALTSGLPIHYFVWRQPAALPLETRIEKAGDMPNVILKGGYDPERVLRDFAPQVWQETHRNAPVVIKFMEAYGHLHEGHRLIAAMVREGDLVQYFGISIVFRIDGELLVKLAPIGQPRPTWGVKQAVRKTAELLQRENPQLHIASSTV